MRNFIWSGEVDKRKLVSVAWKKVCRPFSQGGLNLRSIKTLNISANLNLLWKMLHSDDDWAILLKSRTLRMHKPIQYHIYSSLWSSIKEEINSLHNNSIWLLGTGDNINFWNDSWCGAPLSQALNIPPHISSLLVSKVSDYIIDGEWAIPEALEQMFPILRILIQQATIPLNPEDDQLLWKHTTNGDLDLKQAYSFKLHHSEELQWTKLIWNPDIPPSKSLMVWRLMLNKIPTDDNLMIRGCQLASVCNLCLQNTESSMHLFFSCPYVIKLWSWLPSTLNMVFQFNSIDDIWKI